MMTASCAPASCSDGLLVDGLAKRPARGHPTAASIVQRGGEYGLVVLIGHEGSRWTKEVRTNHGLRKELVCLSKSVGVLPNADGVGSIRGLAVIRTWSAVGKRAAHSDTHSLMLAAGRRFGNRTAMCFLEHPS